MKPLILIGCLACLCALADTNFPIITYSNGVAHTNEYLVFTTNNSYYKTNINPIWIDRNMYIPSSITFITNCSVWDSTNFIIPDSYKGTIQVGDKFYHIDSYTNVQSKIVSVTNVTRVLTTEIIK